MKAFPGTISRLHHHLHLHRRFLGCDDIPVGHVWGALVSLSSHEAIRGVRFPKGVLTI